MWILFVLVGTRVPLRERMRRPCGSATTGWRGTARWSTFETQCCCAQDPGRSPSHMLPRYQRCGRIPKQVKPWGRDGALAICVEWCGRGRGEESHRQDCLLCVYVCVPLYLLRRANDESLLVLPARAHPGRKRSQCTLRGQHPHWLPLLKQLPPSSCRFMTVFYYYRELTLVTKSKPCGSVSWNRKLGTV